MVEMLNCSLEGTFYHQIGHLPRKTFACLQRLYPQKQWISERSCQFHDHPNIAHTYIDNLTALLLALSA